MYWNNIDFDKNCSDEKNISKILEYLNTMFDFRKIKIKIIKKEPRMALE